MVQIRVSREAAMETKAGNKLSRDVGLTNMPTAPTLWPTQVQAGTLSTSRAEDMANS
jgi:hypothetical protein